MRFRVTYLSVFILFWVNVFAQNDSLKYSTSTNLYLGEMPLSKADMYLSDKLEVYFDLPNNHQLVEVSKLTSPQAEHRTFFHYIDGQKVLYSGVKVHQKKDKSVVIQSYLTTLPVKEFVSGFEYLLPLKEGLVSVIKVEDNLISTPQFIYKDKDGLEVFRQNQARYFKKDTIVHGTVFKINPINSANTEYGGIYTDRNDSSYLELQNEMSWVSMPAKFEDDTFYLESEVMRFKSIFPPIEVNDYQQTSDSFNFDIVCHQLYSWL